MSSDLETGNTQTMASGNPEMEPNPSSAVPSNQSGEASQSATTTESFIPEGVDINTLPANVRAIVEKINKDMVRGFTEKTTKLSETTKSEVSKATQALKEKADFYDQIAAQEEFVKQWNEYVQKAQSSQNPESGDLVLDQMKAQLQEVNQKIRMGEVGQIIDAFATAEDEKGNPLHPDFDELNTISLGKLGDREEYSLLRVCVDLAPGKNDAEKLALGYKAAKAIRDSIFEEGRKAGLGRLEKKILNGSNPPTSSPGELQSITEKRPKNAAEALAMAKRGQVVSRD